MPAPCTVCGSAKRAEIEAAIAAGNSERDVAEAWGVGRTALQRHRKHGVAPAAKAKSKRAKVPNEAPSLKRAKPAGIARAKDERRAFDLRLKGKSYTEIADELSCSPSTAFELVGAALERTRGETNEKAQQLRDLEVARCDAIIASFWDRATDPKRAIKTSTAISFGADEPEETEVLGGYDPSQDRAATTLLKAMERKSALLGLDAETGRGVNVTIVQHPSFNAVARAIFDALGPFPDARAAVMARMRAAVAEQRAEAQIVGR